jgi:Domain of unknown function (DUF4157)
MVDGTVVRSPYGDQTGGRRAEVAPVHAREPVRIPPVRSAPRSPGRPLGAGERARMGTAFGMDPGAVRVHTDARADVLNRVLSAEALTVGS